MNRRTILLSFDIKSVEVSHCCGWFVYSMNCLQGIVLWLKYFGTNRFLSIIRMRYSCCTHYCLWFSWFFNAKDPCVV